VTEDDLIQDKFDDNLFQDVFMCLVKLLETDPEESQYLEKEKTARVRMVLDAPPSTPPPGVDNFFREQIQTMVVAYPSF
jgi:hypothetical protein